jgi:L-ascorbate metabolism protein UlaG (beta-lactamase superfamily)
LTRTDHCDGTRFFNPTGAAGQPFSALPRLFRERRTAWPRRLEQPLRRPLPRDGARVVVTFIGHSTFLIQTAAANILTDPMYSRRAGPLNLMGPARVRDPAVPFDALPPIDLVLLSHNHYDHCDRPTLRQLARRFDPIVVTPLGNGPLLRSTGLSRIEELDWWQTAASAPLPVTVTPAQHFSARGPFDRNRALWGGFAFRAAHLRRFFAGDTGYAPFFADIRDRLGAPDLSLLPIGAYEPRWFMKDVHMNPAEALRAHRDLGSAHSIAMHFGTFQLTTEGIDEPLRALDDVRRAQDIPAGEFHALDFGESLRVE